MIETKTKFQQSPFANKKIPHAEVHTPQTTEGIVSEHEEDAFFFRNLEKSGIYLNEKQVEAVRHTEGTVITLAGAGSGKTSVLTARVGYLIQVKKIHPRNILVLTFTVKAADEMKDRISKLPGMTTSMAVAVVAGTFHSIFLKLIRSRGYSQKILSNEKHKQIMIKKILQDLKLKDDYDPETLLSMISLEKNNLKRPDDLPDKRKVEKEFKQIYNLFEEAKQRSNYIDFDDILLETYHLLVDNANLRKQLQHRFQYIEIDEFQDTNLAQYQIIQLIAHPQNNLFVTGDDDQSIYGWRGASNDIILNLPKHYENTNVIALETNYRSNPYIVGLGNELIKENKKRYKKKLHTCHSEGTKPYYVRPDTTFDEANLIIQAIQEQVTNNKRSYGDIAILFRTHSVSRALFDQFILHDIPFVKFGASIPFYEQSVIKPVLDHLRLVMNPHDLDALSGILPSLYLNRDQTMFYVQQNMSRYTTKSVQSLLHLLLMKSDLRPFQVKFIQERIDLLQTIKNMEPKDGMKEIIKGKGKYEDYLQSNDRQTFTMNKDIIAEMLDELLDSAKRFQDIASYLSFISTIVDRHHNMEQHKQDPNYDAISLMSIHNAKGLEFPCVYVIGVSDGILPHTSSLEDAKDRCSTKVGKENIEEAIEEERRLMYVAVTRAKDELYLSSPKWFRNKKLKVSRFFTANHKE